MKLTYIMSALSTKFRFYSHKFSSL